MTREPDGTTNAATGHKPNLEDVAVRGGATEFTPPPHPTAMWGYRTGNAGLACEGLCLIARQRLQTHSSDSHLERQERYFIDVSRNA
jgi:hypothetical protein